MTSRCILSLSLVLSCLDVLIKDYYLSLHPRLRVPVPPSCVHRDNVSEFTDVVCFVNTLTEQARETITVRTFPNQKPWVDRTIRDAVNKRTAAYNEALLSGNMSEYKASCYALRRDVRAAKFRYSERNESHFQLNDSQRMWQGLRTICAFGNKSSAEVRADPLLADVLNTFYGRFECNGGSATLLSSASGSSRQRSDNHVITVSEDEVRRALKRVNVRKAAGPDGITARVLGSCADQLAGLFTSIFNESLATSVVPTSFKKSIIIPVPKNNKPSCLNDYRPVALTSIVMKVFEIRGNSDAQKGVLDRQGEQPNREAERGLST